MKMIKAIIRPEKSEFVASRLLAENFPAMTKMDVYGRGKQKGLQMGSVFFDELPKSLIFIVVEDEDVDKVIDIITDAARTGDEGNYGDGRIFVTNVDKAYTISTKKAGL